MTRRDTKLKLQTRFGQKQEKSARYRAVLCASDGSRTAGSVWANEDFKLVYFQFFGSGGVGVARCQKIEPELGLGVYVGKTDDNLEWQVLEDDPFLRRTATDARGYQSVAARDFEPGGRLQLWLYSKLIVPLATYDTPGTLEVNVVAGDYPYEGVRKTFAGQTGIDLTASVPANPGETRYVGLYLDSANTLQTIDGTAGATPTEPAWPAGAFRLSVVQLDNGQTSISFADDIFDRRMLWVDTDILGVPIAGAIITGDATPQWVVLPPGEVGQYVTKNAAGILEWRDIPTIGITEFLYDLASDIATYFQLDTNIPTGGDQTIVSGAISASNTLVAAIATNANEPAVEFINDGVWHLHLHAQKSGPGTKDLQLKFRVYSRTSGGVETQIGAGYSEVTANLTTSEAEYDLHLVLDEVTIALTDRIVLKIYADISGAGTDPTVTLTVEGDTGSRLEIPALVSGTGGNKGWPVATKAMINNTEYDDIQDAIDAMAAGDIIKVGQGTDSGGIIIDAAGAVVGLSPEETIITASADDSVTVSATGTPVTLKSVTVANTGEGTEISCVSTAQNALTIDGCIVEKTSGAPTTAIGVNLTDGDNHRITNTQITVSAGTNKYGIYTGAVGSTSVIIEADVVINGATYDINIGNSSDVIKLNGCHLLGGGINNAAGGTIVGWYYNAAGDKITINRIDEAKWFDFPLADRTNFSGLSSHLRDNTATYPAGWTEADAAASVNTNRLYSFWHLQGSSTDTTWKYRRKSAVNLEALSASNYASFMFGPLLWRDANYTADLHWRLGIYRDNAGAIDEQTYVRVDLYWNQASGIWQYRLEEKDGTTAHTSAYLTLDSKPLLQGLLWFRINVQNAATKPVRGHVGSTPIPLAHTMFATQTPSTAQTWGDIWVQIELSRGAGVTDALFIGAIDYSNDA